MKVVQEIATKGKKEPHICLRSVEGALKGSQPSQRKEKEGWDCQARKNESRRGNEGRRGSERVF